jgi:transposase InsO family protein
MYPPSLQELVSATDKYEKPTRRVHELWQTDFTQFKVIYWGWYYLSTVLDDYSRYILSWKLSPTMNADDVEETLMMALKKSGLEQARVRHRPRLLTDNGPAYLSKDLARFLKRKHLKDLARFLKRKHLEHIRGAPYHPMTQGKIERFHRSMKNVILLQNYYSPSGLKKTLAEFVEYYNNERYLESLNNLTPADIYFGKFEEVLTRREETKRKTMQQRRSQNLQPIHV